MTVVGLYDFTIVLPQRVGGSRRFALKALGVGLAGASVGADLGGSSKYSSEILED